MSDIKTLLVIENSQDHWRRIQETMSRFVRVYPGDDTEFSEFYRYVSDCAKPGSTAKDLAALKEKIERVNPTVALIDVDLLGETGANRTGETIYLRIIQPKQIPSRLFTASRTGADGIPAEIYFRKNHNGPVLMDLAIRDQVLPWLCEQLNLNVSNVAQVFDQSVGDRPVKKNLVYRVDQLRPAINYAITLLFIGSALLSVLMMCWKLISEVFHAKAMLPIKIAEDAFLFFLPFTIIMSFYAFYLKAFRPMIMGEKEPLSTNLEDAGVLMHLSKKLFISTLISFLFLSFIEKLSDDDAILDWKVWAFGIMAIVLIPYFMYLNKPSREVNS